MYCPGACCIGAGSDTWFFFFFLRQKTQIKRPAMAIAASGPTITPAIHTLLLLFWGVGVGVRVGVVDCPPGGTVTVVWAEEGSVVEGLEGIVVRA